MTFRIARANMEDCYAYASRDDAAFVGRGIDWDTEESFAQFGIEQGAGPVEPKIIVNYYNSDGSPQRLKEGRDYEVAYSDNEAPGTATATVTGMGDYIGQTTTTFQLVSLPYSIKNFEIDFEDSITAMFYSGTPCEPEVQFGSYAMDLRRGVDYEIEYLDNTKTGEATAIVRGIGRYCDECVLHFHVEKGPIDLAQYGRPSFSSDGEGDKLVYNGRTPEPPLSIDVQWPANGEWYFANMVPGVDYIVSYSDVKDDTMTATITGIGALSGTITKTFEICDGVDVENVYPSYYQSEVLYTGNPVEPEVEFYLPGSNFHMVKGRDYEVSYSNNVEVGTGTMTVTGIGSFWGTHEIEFDIVKNYTLPQLEDCTVKVLDEKLVYTGSAQYPRVEATLNETGEAIPLHGAGFNADDPVNVGKVDFVMTPGGYPADFGGIMRGSYEIVPASISAEGVVVQPIKAMPYTGSALKPPVRIAFNGHVLVGGRDYTLAYSNNVNAGSGKVTIAGKGNFIGSRTESFEISKDLVDLSKCTVASIDRQVYTGKQICPKPAVSYGGRTLQEGVDYTLAYSNNVNVGSGKIVITGLGKCTGERSVLFAILAKARNADKVINGEGSVTENLSALASRVYELNITRNTILGIGFNCSPSSARGLALFESASGATLGGLSVGDGRVAGPFVLAPGKYYLDMTVSSAGFITTSFLDFADDDVRAGVAESSLGIPDKGKGISIKDVSAPVPLGVSFYGSLMLPNYTVSEMKDADFYSFKVDRKRKLSLALAAKMPLQAYVCDENEQILKNPDTGRNLVITTDGPTDNTTGMLDLGTLDSGTYYLVIMNTSNPNTALDCLYVGAIGVSMPDASASASNCVYNGSAQKPAVTVKYDGVTLKEGGDYTVSYSNNVNAGIAQASIIGKGDYVGTKVITFKIGKAKGILQAKAKTAKKAVKVKAGKKVAAKKYVKITKKVGDLSYKLIKAPKSIKKFLKVNAKTGAITVIKKAKRGTFTIKVKLGVGSNNYTDAGKTVKVKLRIS